MTADLIIATTVPVGEVADSILERTSDPRHWDSG